MPQVARLNDISDHGGKIISASDITSDNLGIATNADKHSCPISGHGITTLGPGLTNVLINNKPVIVVGMKAECGATILPNNATVFAGT